MKEVADAQNKSRPLKDTAFAKVAKVLDRILLDGDNAKTFSMGAFNQSSGRIPKALRPQFPPVANLEPAVVDFQQRYTTATISSFRKTIEIYEHGGSDQKFEAMLDESCMRALIPDGQPSDLIVTMLARKTTFDEAFRREFKSTCDNVVDDGDSDGDGEAGYIEHLKRDEKQRKALRRKMRN